MEPTPRDDVVSTDTALPDAALFAIASSVFFNASSSFPGSSAFCICVLPPLNAVSLRRYSELQAGFDSPFEGPLMITQVVILSLFFVWRAALVALSRSAALIFLF